MKKIYILCFLGINLSAALSFAVPGDDEDEELRRALELSLKSYEEDQRDQLNIIQGVGRYDAGHFREDEDLRRALDISRVMYEEGVRGLGGDSRVMYEEDYQVQFLPNQSSRHDSDEENEFLRALELSRQAYRQDQRREEEEIEKAISGYFADQAGASFDEEDALLRMAISQSLQTLGEEYSRKENNLSRNDNKKGDEIEDGQNAAANQSSPTDQEVMCVSNILKEKMKDYNKALRIFEEKNFKDHGDLGNVGPSLILEAFPYGVEAGSVWQEQLARQILVDTPAFKSGKTLNDIIEIAKKALPEIEAYANKENAVSKESFFGQEIVIKAAAEKGMKRDRALGAWKLIIGEE